jgi:hypothetical protein
VDGADDLSATTSPVTCTFSWTTAAGYGAIISNYKPN